MSLSIFIIGTMIPDDLTADQIYNEIEELKDFIGELEGRLYELEAEEN